VPVEKLKICCKSTELSNLGLTEVSVNGTEKVKSMEISALSFTEMPVEKW